MKLTLTFRFLYLLFALLSLSNPTYAQGNMELSDYQNMKISRNVRIHPELLAEKLTAGKQSEKEKFDAIFNWVVFHIAYDTRFYDSGKGNYTKSIRSVLRRQRGVCTDYARVMDTLCRYAGIENVTVLGYAKEINFDINDSLYFDNHAWNAVKLDRTWYVYDATWSAGGTVYDYTRMAKWRNKKLEKLGKRTREKTITLSIKRKGNAKCGPRKIDYYRNIVNINPWFVRVQMRLLSAFPFRIKQGYQKVLNTEYYLTNPSLFAVTHFPNNPIWKLNERISTVSEFSSDLAYYDPAIKANLSKERGGTFCLECDDYAGSTEQEQERLNNEASLKNNSNNHLLPANYQLFLGLEAFDRMRKTTDSLTKMQLIDSCTDYLAQSNGLYRLVRSDYNLEYRFQSTKNKAKKIQLKKDNKALNDRLKRTFTDSNTKARNIRNLSTQAVYLQNTVKNQLNQFNRSISKKSVPKELKPDIIASLSAKVEEKMRAIDSLSEQLSNQHNSIISGNIELFLNLNQSTITLNPMLIDFNTDISLRIFQLDDSYKKRVRDVRDSLDKHSIAFYESISTGVLQQSDSIVALFRLRKKEIANRHSMVISTLSNLIKLHDAGVISSDSLERFSTHINELYTTEQCTDLDEQLLFTTTATYFKKLTTGLTRYKKVIAKDSKMEGLRYTAISKHIINNKVRVRNVEKGNQALARRVVKETSKIKKEFLKKK